MYYVSSIRHKITFLLKRIFLFIKNNKKRSAMLFVAVLVVANVFYFSVYRAPTFFPVSKIITIEEGETLSNIATQFEEKNIVRSSSLLENIVILLNKEDKVYHGDYFFSDRESVLKIAKRITSGDFGLESMQVVIPEGATLEEMSLIFAKKFDNFDTEEFSQLTKDKEGYLFPDTYSFLPNVKTKEIVRALESTFFERISEIEDALKKIGKSVNDIVIMASILEEEARTTETRRTIAGILWKRIEIGMPLQVDAVFTYANGKNSFTLTTADLREDHPYNTYTNKGLPPTPISNPGLDSLLAAINPILTDYLYFLSDMQGNMHYSETFEEHKRYKRIYLN